MKPFKFFLGNVKIQTQFIPLITSDTDTTYHIPIDMYGHILELAVDLYSENMSLFNPVEYRIENEIGLVVSYFYKINNVVPYFNNTGRIMIEYGIKFPDTEYYCNFTTSERVSLYETV